MKSNLLKSGLLVLGMVAALSRPAEAVERGRDPWAFRLIFEDRPRMLVLALRSDLWAAYNPATGSLYKVWNGQTSFRGKVYDFGQRNTAATGTVFFREERAYLLEASNESSLPAGWTATGVSTGASAWTLDSSTSSLITPAMDATGYGRILAVYETPGGNNRLLVDVSDDNGATWTAQNWMSIDSPAQDGHLKEVTPRSTRLKLRFRRNTSGSTATLANVRVQGDFAVWSLTESGIPVAATIDWRGYRLINQTDGVVLSYDLVLPSGRRLAITEQPEALAGAALSRAFTVAGLAAGEELSLLLDGSGQTAAHTITGDAALRDTGGNIYLDFSQDGSANLQTQWTP